jgi:hypothetical protein
VWYVMYERNTVSDSLIRKAETLLWCVIHKESNFLPVFLFLIISLFYHKGASGMNKIVQQCHGDH